MLTHIGVWVKKKIIIIFFIPDANLTSIIELSHYILFESAFCVYPHWSIPCSLRELMHASKSRPNQGGGFRGAVMSLRWEFQLHGMVKKMHLLPPLEGSRHSSWFPTASRLG